MTNRNWAFFSYFADGQDVLATNENDSCEEEDECIPGCTLFVKNLNFSTAEESLKKVSFLLGSERPS